MEAQLADKILLQCWGSISFRFAGEEQTGSSSDLAVCDAEQFYTLVCAFQGKKKYKKNNVFNMWSISG